MESLNTQLLPFFEWLLRTTVQASLLICVILLLQRILRNRLCIRWHYGLWLLLLVRMSLPWAPQSRASLFNLIPRSAHQQQAEYEQQETGRQSVGSDVAGSESVESVAASPSTTTQESPEVVTVTPSINQAVQNQLKPDFSRIVKILPLLWLTGALALAVYVGAGNFNLWRIVKRRRPLTDQKILELLEDCKAQMGIQTILGIVPTDKVESPALFGFVRPRLLLPEGMIEALSREELRYVLFHELAHLKRHDIYIGWLMSLLQVLHWFNPLVWLAFYRMRSDRELACDALVLARTQSEEPKSYGRIIVSLVERFSRPRRLPGMAGILETKAQLKRRVIMIAKFKKNSYQWSPLSVFLIIFLACISVPDAISIKASQKSTPHITLRQVWSGPDADAYGSPSPDGRYLSHTDWKNGDLAIRELATGKTRHLTETKEGGREKFFRFALDSVISPDDKLIAYSWTNQYGTYDLCVIAADGSGDRVLYSSKDYEIYPASWSSDCKRIAARKYASKGGMEIVSVSVTDGSLHVLKTSEKYFWPYFCYSPDDRFIACDFPVAENSENYDIILIRADGSGEIPLITHPANDRLMGWVPDSNEVLFRSDRSGTHDIWAVRVVDGKVQDSPRPVTRDVGEISPEGFARGGSFYFSRYKRRYTSQTFPFNAQTGEIQVQLGKPILGSNYSPAWSPDGEHIVYVEEQTQPAGPGWYHRPLHIRKVKTGEERILADEFTIRGPRWSPDGRTILFTGADRRKHRQLDYNGGVYTVDVQDDQVTELVQFPPVKEWSRDIWTRSNAEWARDGNAIFYTSRGKIIRRDFESGQEELLYHSDNLTRALDVSPDGKTLVFGNGLSGEGQGQVMSIPVSGGQATELCRMQESKGGLKTPRQLTWTPDGNYVLFAKEEEKGATLWRVSSSGGEPDVIGAMKDIVTDLSIHPNKDEIAVSTYMQEHSIWVMENFLPDTPVAKPEPTTTLRQIEVRGRGSVHSRPSFDGKYMLDVDKETGNLISREIATGKERVLTKNSDPNWFVHGSLISHDSKKAAFYHYNPDKEDFDLRIVGIDGSNLRTLLGTETAGYFNMDAWSPDGKYIFGMLMKKPVQLARLSTDDGSIQVLKTFDQGKASRIDVSPDGRYIAYSYAEQDKSKPDIFIFDLEQNKETPLVKHPAADKLLGWTPDGQHIFFTSDRNRTWDGWLLRVVDGKPAGLPEMIKAGMGDVSPIGFTENRSFYYSFGHQGWNVYTVILDSNKGEVLSDPNPVRGIGNDGCPDWSPDGRYLAYCSQLNNDKAQIIRIRTLVTDQERELKTDLPYFDWLRWCPDSRHLLITNFNSQSVVYMIDTQTGEYTSLVKSDRQKIRQAELSADGKTLFYRIRGRGTENWLIIRDLETGSEKELLRTEGATALSPFIRGWALSDDGKHIAYSIREEANNPFALKIMSIADGQARTIVGNGMVTEVAWINDDRDLLFVKNLSELCRVSVEGGVPQKLWEWKEMIVGPRLSPDGQRIAFHSGGFVSEMWVMENFLPASVAAARK